MTERPYIKLKIQDLENKSLCAEDSVLILDELKHRKTKRAKKLRLTIINRLTKNKKMIQDVNKPCLWDISNYSDKLASISEFMFSVRTSNCLESENIQTLEEIIEFGKVRLMRIPNFGKKSLTEIEETLKRLLTQDKGGSSTKISSKHYVNAQLDFIDKYKKIIDDWNTTPMNRSEIGEIHGLSRERVRQIVKQAEDLKITVVDAKTKRRIRQEDKRTNLTSQYLQKFIESYKSGSSQQEISKIFGISIQQVKELEDIALKGKKITRHLIRKKETEPYILKRQKEVLLLRSKKYSIPEVAATLGVSEQTISKDIKQMKLNGIVVPHSAPARNFLSEEKINFRTSFIEAKMKEGWTKAKIAEGLGLASAHAITRHIKLYMYESSQDL